MSSTSGDTQVHGPGEPDPERDLTPRQRDVLQAIEGFRRRHHYGPSVRDIGQVVGLGPPACSTTSPCCGRRAG